MAESPPKTMEQQMTTGCGWFLVAAFGGFALGVWPFIAYAEGWNLDRLATNAAIAGIPSLLIGALLARRSIAGGLGFVASALAVAVFMYLRLEAAELLAKANEKTPDWPPIFKLLVPLGWVLVASFVAIVFAPKE